MAEKGFFFNAFPDSSTVTGYDRNYNADDISQWLATVWDTGVVKTNVVSTEPQGLKVVANVGMGINVQAGKAAIQGKPYSNTALVSFTVATAPTGSSSRYDYVILRMDNTQTQSGRNTSLMLVTGDSNIPTVSNLTRTSDVYDLMLAYIEVQPNATSIAQAQITDCRGDQTLCPWFTAVKGYDEYYDAIVQQFESNITLTSAGTVAVTNIAANLYNSRYSLVEVYCNGLKEENTDYTVSTSGGFITITFTQQKSAGAQISVVLNNFIDGEGLATVIGSYNEWVNDVATLKEAFDYTYICNGLNDNQQITNIVNTFMSGGTDYSSLNLKIVGTFGCNNGTQYPVPVGGAGTSANPYMMFNFNTGNRKVNLDFSNCSQINLSVSGVYVYVFAGSNFNVTGLNLVANGTTSGTSIVVFNGNVTCENSRFWINGYLSSYIGKEGTYTNCRGSVSNASGNSYCFLNTDLLRLNGGEYLAYTGTSSARSAVVGQSASNAVAILYGVSAPTVSRNGYYQVNSVYQVGTGNYINCTDLVSALPLYVTTGYSNIRGTIALSKPQ